jgi:hypothetical protein
MAERSEFGTLYWNSWKQAFKILNLTSGISIDAFEKLFEPVTDLYIEVILSTTSCGGW